MPDKKRILCFGDSLTWGLDPETLQRFPEESRWPKVLEKELAGAFTVIEEGQNGRTVATDDPAEGEKNGIRYIGPCLESHSPLAYVVIMLGSNDCKRKYSYAAMDIGGEMKLFLEKVIAYDHFRCNDSFRVILISPPLISGAICGSWLGDIFGYENAVKVSSEIASWYRELCCQYKCHFINAAEYGVKTSAADGLHLDAENQRKLGKAVAEYIRGLE